MPIRYLRLLFILWSDPFTPLQYRQYSPHDIAAHVRYCRLPPINARVCSRSHGRMVQSGGQQFVLQCRGTDLKGVLSS